jgi:hypothetical protein
LPAARNADRVIKLRKEKVEVGVQYIDFTKNCVLIDEAGFNMHTSRNFGRTLRGTPAKGIVPTGRGVTASILGAISQARVIDIPLRKPQTVSTSKKRKANGKSATVITGRIGTRTEHYLAYLSNIMDVLDRNNKKGLYLCNGQCANPHSSCDSCLD